MKQTVRYYSYKIPLLGLISTYSFSCNIYVKAFFYLVRISWVVPFFFPFVVVVAFSLSLCCCCCCCLFVCLLCYCCFLKGGGGRKEGVESNVFRDLHRNCIYDVKTLVFYPPPHPVPHHGLFLHPNPNITPTSCRCYACPSPVLYPNVSFLSPVFLFCS